MNRQPELGQARREGRLAAERLRNELGLADVSWVDVFDVIESGLNLDLLFRPLEGLYGFYWPHGRAGIVVNASHPSSLQRFTAAHELGHHVLGHGESVDEVRNIEGALGIDGAEDFERRVVARSTAEIGNALEEAAAQAFAGSFLMPLLPVNRYLKDHTESTHGGRLTAAEIYQLSVGFGASYDAACTQLAALNKIEWSYRSHLLDTTGALEVATRIGFGVAPRHSRGDVVVGDAAPGSQVMEHDSELVVEVTETPSNGHVWTVEDVPAQLEVMEDSVAKHDHDGEILGAAQTRHFRFAAKQAGHGSVRLALRPAWSPRAEAVDYRVVEVTVNEPVFDFGCALSRRTLRSRVAMAQSIGVE